MQNKNTDGPINSNKQQQNFLNQLQIKTDPIT